MRYEHYTFRLYVVFYNSSHTILINEAPGALVKVNSVINSTKYQDILAKNVVASTRRVKLGHKWILQQDNDPNNTSKSTKKW
jgi:hypothetical protein